MAKKNLFYALFLNSLSRMTFQQFNSLMLVSDGNLENIFHFSKKDLLAISHMNPYLLENILKAKKEPQSLEWIEKEMEIIQKEKINLISYWEDAYPRLLKEISDPPPLLYVKGQLPKTKLCVGVVGARKASAYGLEVTEILCQELASYDVTIVSGLALGVDGKAHEATLKAKGSTVAILGNGISHIYPKEHASLYQRIAEEGALISEFPMTMKAFPQHFPRRNRILSGLCQGVIVIEASIKSGSLITARCALDHGRDVFAVPGNIHSRSSEGTHFLIQQGAKLVAKASDVLEELDPQFIPKSLTPEPQSCHSISQDEEKLLYCLKDDSTSFEELLFKSSVSSEKLSELLLACELKGFIQKTNHHTYKKGALCPNL